MRTVCHCNCNNYGYRIKALLLLERGDAIVSIFFIRFNICFQTEGHSKLSSRRHGNNLLKSPDLAFISSI